MLWDKTKATGSRRPVPTQRPRCPLCPLASRSVWPVPPASEKNQLPVPPPLGHVPTSAERGRPWPRSPSAPAFPRQLGCGVVPPGSKAFPPQTPLRRCGAQAATDEMGAARGDEVEIACAAGTVAGN